MNERIQKLAEQSGLYDEKSPDEVPEFTACFEKFAELIVRECASQCLLSPIDYVLRGEVYANRIKQRFGVE